MRFLLDEDVSAHLAPGLTGLFPDDEFEHIVSVTGRAGTQDDDIPSLCQERGFDVLVTLNIRDFGAKRHYYASLSDHRVHVVVLSPGKIQPDVGQQAAMLTGSFSLIRRWMNEADEPLLVMVRRQDARKRTIDELVTEITGGRRAASS